MCVGNKHDRRAALSICRISPQKITSTLSVIITMTKINYSHYNSQCPSRLSVQLNSGSGDYGSKKYKRGYGGTHGVVGFVLLHLAGISLQLP